MVNLEQLKDYMKKRAEEDRSVRSVQVTGASLEDALRSAALELGLPVKRLEYDTLQKGAPGFMGVGAKPWSIIAYAVAKKSRSGANAGADGLIPDLDQTVEAAEVDLPGKAYVRLYHDGAYLKVVPPVGSGEPATEEMAFEALQARGVREINRQAVKGAIKMATGNYVHVGEYIHNPASDTMWTVQLEDQEMRAVVILTPPGAGGADASREELEHFLRTQGVVHGIQDDLLNNLVDEPRYNERCEVAVGSKPINGKDAKITYFFDTSVKIKPQEKDGRVDFKNLNTIHNVIKGEELAKKEPAEKGIHGRTVTGRAIPAKDGKDVNFELGNSVQLSRDGLKVISTADGQVMLIQNKITVETVMVVPGDVNNAVGNINSFGSVIVRGSVEDGFSIKAAGNIEVLGNVGKSFLETPGDIIVHQGINGNGGGQVMAGQSVWSKFIQNAFVNSGDYVIVSDGIMHSTVVAGKKILCKGKRAKIVGGHLKASEEINASSLGAVGAGETTLEVGFDPKVKEELDRMVEEKENLEKDFATVNLNLQGLLKQERIIKKLPPEKAAILKDLKIKAVTLQSEINKATVKLEKRQAELDAVRLLGKISSSGQVFPGTKIIIKDAEYDVTRDFSGVTFIREGSAIRTMKYEEIDEEEIIRRI